MQQRDDQKAAQHKEDHHAHGADNWDRAGHDKVFDEDKSDRERRR